MMFLLKFFYDLQAGTVNWGVVVATGYGLLGVGAIGTLIIWAPDKT